MRPTLTPGDLADACIALLTEGSLDGLLKIDDGSWWTPEQLELWSAAYGDLAESLHQAMRVAIQVAAEQMVADLRKTRRIQAEQANTLLFGDAKERSGEAWSKISH